MHRYIQIGSDAGYSRSLPRQQIENRLRGFPEIVADSLHGFKNSDSAPWFRINVGVCDSCGNYPARLPRNDGTANMIELICAETAHPVADNYFTGLAETIAGQLGWIIVPQDA